LQKIEEEFFYAIFFLFTLYFCLPFLDGSKRNVAQQILHLTSNDQQIEYIWQKKYETQRKKKTKREGPINKSTKIPKYFWNFLILKRAYLLGKIQPNWPGYWFRLVTRPIYFPLQVCMNYSRTLATGRR